jgi:hypothetical protein
MTIFDILKSGNIDVHISAHLLVVCVISWIIVSLFSLSISEREKREQNITMTNRKREKRTEHNND